MGLYTYFHSTFDKISNKLFNELEINNGSLSIKVRALWDTGASNSCISSDVVRKLSLVPNERVLNYSISGVSECNAYIINIKLPNDMLISDVLVPETQIDLQGFDVLIGMDIINLGDFSISNYDGKTILGFRYPSIRNTDLSK